MALGSIVSQDNEDQTQSTVRASPLAEFWPADISVDYTRRGDPETFAVLVHFAVP